MVTEVKVDTTGKKPYSIYTTTDGSTWTAVDGAVNVKADGVASGATISGGNLVVSAGGTFENGTEFRVLSTALALPKPLLRMVQSSRSASVRTRAGLRSRSYVSRTRRARSSTQTTSRRPTP